MQVLLLGEKVIRIVDIVYTFNIVVIFVNVVMFVSITRVDMVFSIVRNFLFVSLSICLSFVSRSSS